MGARRDAPPRWQIADVLDRTDLAALLDELTVPSTRLGPGRRWHCPMPDHDDHRASVTMHRDHRGHERWRCWSGDHRGDAIDLVTVVSHRSRAEAIEWLATRAGMSPDRPRPPIPPRRRAPAPSPATTMDPVVARYVRACHRILDTAGGKPVRTWLHERGFDAATLRANLVGADPGRSMLRRARGLPYGSAMAATFPTLDPAGNITYVQSRYLDPDATGRKYDNPSAALAPHPRLGFTASTTMRAPDHLLVCEGMPDALTAAQAGYRSVGLLGAHTPDDAVAARLANHADNSGTRLVIVRDPDPAGRRVAETLGPLLSERGHEPIVITPPGGVDLNDWSRHDHTWADELHHQIGNLADRAQSAECLRATQRAGIEL